MANRNQQRGGQQHYQDRGNNYGSRNQMGGVGPQQAYQGQQSAYQGNHGQFGGNYGHDTNYQGPLPYGNPENQGDFRGFTENFNSHYGSEGHSGATLENPVGLSRDYGYNPRETNANDHWEPENSRGPRGYGHSQSHGGPLSHPYDTQRGWPSSQPQYDRFQRTTPLSGYDQGRYDEYSGNAGLQHYDPDYQQWRNEQIRGLDNDYKAWRDERYSNFSNEFGEWRKSRKDNNKQSGSASGVRGASDTESSSSTKSNNK